MDSTKVTLVIFKKPWGEKIQLNISKSIEVFNETFQYKIFCSFSNKNKVLRKGNDEKEE